MHHLVHHLGHLPEAIEFFVALVLGAAGYMTAILSSKIQINGHNIWDRRLVWGIALMLGIAGGLLLLVAVGVL